LLEADDWLPAVGDGADAFFAHANGPDVGAGAGEGEGEGDSEGAGDVDLEAERANANATATDEFDVDADAAEYNLDRQLAALDEQDPLIYHTLGEKPKAGPAKQAADQLWSRLAFAQQMYRNDRTRYEQHTRQLMRELAARNAELKTERERGEALLREMKRDATRAQSTLLQTSAQQSSMLQMMLDRLSSARKMLGVSEQSGVSLTVLVDDEKARVPPGAHPAHATSVNGDPLRHIDAKVRAELVADLKRTVTSEDAARALLRSLDEQIEKGAAELRTSGARENAELRKELKAALRLLAAKRFLLVSAKELRNLGQRAPMLELPD
jgi:hypothetical protein